MRSSIFTPFLALSASVSALTITFPAQSTDSKPASVDLSVDNTITWEKVSTDISTVKISLTSVNAFPVQSIEIASSVSTDDLKYTMKPQSNVTVGNTYQIGFFNGTQNSIIAQSMQFTVSKAAPNTSTTTSAAASGSGSATGTAATTSSTNAAGALKACGGVGLLVGLAALFL